MQQLTWSHYSCVLSRTGDFSTEEGTAVPKRLDVSNILIKRPQLSIIILTLQMSNPDSAQRKTQFRVWISEKKTLLDKESTNRNFYQVTMVTRKYWDQYGGLFACERGGMQLCGNILWRSSPSSCLFVSSIN